jgi:hypothetical protein
VWVVVEMDGGKVRVGGEVKGRAFIELLEGYHGNR